MDRVQGIANGSGHNHQSSQAKTDSLFTPPQTPLYSDQHEEEPPELESSGFHNYLRAFYPYHPASTITSGDGDEASVTVPINQGDVILVHSVQPNGWADGTLLASGARGWLPTNYCEPYDPDFLRNLLDALTYTWEFIRGHEEDEPQVFMGQDYVRGMIAGIRLLLQRTNCLSREEVSITNINTLRRSRRHMLSELSSFSKAASSLQEVCQNDVPTEHVYDLLDDIIIKAFRVTTKATRFLDCWSHHFDHGNTENTPPLTPPLLVSDQSAQQDGSCSQRQSMQSANVPLASPTSSVDPRSRTSSMQPTDSLDVPHSTPVRPIRPSSLVQKRVSACHRLSYGGRWSMARDRKFASDSLTVAHDAFLSSLAVFTGLHLQSRASVELLSETKQAVVSCSGLLDILEEIMTRDTRHSRALHEAKEHLKRSLAALIQTIGAQPTDEDDLVLPNPENPPIQAATSCVRSASACVSEAQVMIQRTGDFELSSDRNAAGLGISQGLEPTSVGQKEKPSPLIFESGYEVIQKPLPLSPPPPSPPSQMEKQAATLSPSPFTTGFDQSSSIDGTSSRASCDTVTRSESSDEPAALPEHRKLPSLELEISAMSPILFEKSASPGQDHEAHEESRGVSFTGTVSTDYSSFRSSFQSETSTVATTPDHSPVKEASDHDSRNGSFGSLSESQSTLGDDVDEEETELLTTTYAHELLVHRDGQILGGSLAALVERLTIHDVTPDAMFVNTFYLCFRQFCTPTEFAQSLADRFNYIGSSPAIAKPVRLRVYNVLKGWLELHWRCETDNEAIPVVEALAQGSLKDALPSASGRLVELLDKSTHTTNNGNAARVVSLQGKTNTVIGSSVNLDAPLPSPIINKSQLNTLKKFELTGGSCGILDFDPLELARQLTIFESKVFCRIIPDELIDCEWQKPSAVSKSVNVKAMSKLSTSLGDLVCDSILHHEDVKKRALVLKQWIKIARRCREIFNYDSLVAIVAALNSSMVNRLKKTWELMSPKTMARLNELQPLIEGRMGALRKLVENHGAPCLPFVGMTLTDLAMGSEGNGKLRSLDPHRKDGKYVINFDRYVKTARAIGDLQRFQVPFHFAAVPEMQYWINAQIARMQDLQQLHQEDSSTTVKEFYRRSCMLEARDEHSTKPSPDLSTLTSSSSSAPSGNEKIRHKQSFWTSLGLHQKEKLSV